MDILQQDSIGAIPPQAYDLWNLYRAVRQTRPRQVLEFGVGYSTIVLAEALRRFGGGKLVSVDASRKWLAETERRLPPQLRNLVTFYYSPVAITEHKGEKCHIYVNLPDVTPDLIYLDAPQPADIQGWEGKPLAADILKLESRLRPGALIIVDSRKDNVAFLRRHLTRNYRFRQHDIFGVTRLRLIR